MKKKLLIMITVCMLLAFSKLTVLAAEEDATSLPVEQDVMAEVIPVDDNSPLTENESEEVLEDDSQAVAEGEDVLAPVLPEETAEEPEDVIGEMPAEVVEEPETEDVYEEVVVPDDEVGIEGETTEAQVDVGETETLVEEQPLVIDSKENILAENTETLVEETALVEEFDTVATLASSEMETMAAPAIEGITLQEIPGVMLSVETKPQKESGFYRGIDVSSHQGQIDWAQVAASGQVDFAIVRSLCWNKSTNSYGIDSSFVYNVTEARKYGIEVGTYLYSYAFNERQFTEEVDFFLNSPEIKNLMNSGFRFDLPVYLDYEDPLILKNTKNATERTNHLAYGLSYLEQRSFRTAL